MKALEIADMTDDIRLPPYPECLREAREWETAGLHERLRLLEVDHAPEGWPAVQMRDITALLDELDTLREALRECLRINETDAGNDVKAWANAMLNAHAALAREA